MRMLAAFPILFLAAACADAGVVRPEAGSFPDRATFDRAMDMPGALEFYSEVTFVATLEPGDTRVTPSGVIHVSDLVNEWAMVGDLNGPWYFAGDVHVSLKTGMGRPVSIPVSFEVQSSTWGMTGSFACNASFKAENYPTPQFTQHGILAGCHGTGDFDGMNLWAEVSNENSPGLPSMGSPSIYDFHGVIW